MQQSQSEQSLGQHHRRLSLGKLDPAPAPAQLEEICFSDIERGALLGKVRPKIIFRCKKYLMILLNFF